MRRLKISNDHHTVMITSQALSIPYAAGLFIKAAGDRIKNFQLLLHSDVPLLSLPPGARYVDY